MTLSAAVTRMKQIARGMRRELRGGFSLTADPRSFARFAADVFLLRLARLVPLPGRNRERRIRVRGERLHLLSPAVRVQPVWRPRTLCSACRQRAQR
jgi:hypothetical protein